MYMYIGFLQIYRISKVNLLLNKQMEGLCGIAEIHSEPSTGWSPSLPESFVHFCFLWFFCWFLCWFFCWFFILQAYISCWNASQLHTPENISCDRDPSYLIKLSTGLSPTCQGQDGGCNAEAQLLPDQGGWLTVRWKLARRSQKVFQTLEGSPISEGDLGTIRRREGCIHTIELEAFNLNV